MGRKSGVGRIKSLRTYTYEVAAQVAGVHVRTVRNWVRNEGLEAMTGQRPHLIRGDALIAFQRRRKASAKMPLRQAQFYCLKCRAARDPAAGMVDCTILRDVRANLCALCPVCATVMNKRIAMTSIEGLSRILAVTIRRV